MSKLAGRRILLAEDEFLIAAMATDMLTDLGAVVVGPAADVISAVALARTEALDAALLDLNLNGECSDAVAEALSARGIPFVVATGYGTEARRRRDGAAILDKPYTREDLRVLLEQAIEPGR